MIDNFSADVLPLIKLLKKLISNMTYEKCSKYISYFVNIVFAKT